MTRSIDHTLQQYGWAVRTLVCLFLLPCAIAGCGSRDVDDDAGPADVSSADRLEPNPDRLDSSEGGEGDGETVQTEPETPEPAPMTSTDPVSVESNAVTAPVHNEVEAAAELERQLSEYQVPPVWLGDVTSTWDVAGKPWSEARLEIRRLLGLNDEAARREGIKLTWDYLQKEDIGNGHEYGMYMFLGNEPLWAILAYRQEINGEELEYTPYFAFQALASLYADYGVFEEGEQVLLRGLNTPPPDAAWRDMRAAEMHDALGDLYVAWGRIDDARTHYEEAVRLYPLAKPPYGQHLLPRRAAKVQSKLDLLAASSLQDSSLRDGNYRQQALGYSGDINLTVRVSGGRIADIGIEHQEKIDQNACVIIPQRIVEQQSLQVDGITGATITKDAIVDGTLHALRQAGLE